jgi:hypothetical protein
MYRYYRDLERQSDKSNLCDQLSFEDLLIKNMILNYFCRINLSKNWQILLQLQPFMQKTIIITLIFEEIAKFLLKFFKYHHKTTNTVIVSINIIVINTNSSSSNNKNNTNNVYNFINCCNKRGRRCSVSALLLSVSIQQKVENL